MAELAFHLPVFDGPLDLLLHLISKHKLDIHDIPIAELLEQYLAYLDECAARDYDLAGEFLEMAARLIYMKTAALLPSPEVAEVMKKELEGALIEYSLCKRAAAALAERNRGDTIFVRRPMAIPVDLSYCLMHDAELLREAYLHVGTKPLPGKAPASRTKINAVVQKKTVSVISKVVFVLRKLYADKFVRIDRLYDDMTDRSARVATFLAILELTRAGRTALSDDNTTLTMLARKPRAQRTVRKRNETYAAQ